MFEQYIAHKILKINERKRWSYPPPNDPVQRALQDEEIFQTAKLVKYAFLFALFLTFIDRLRSSCGHFMSCITGDYAAGFLGSSEGCNFNMNPFDVSHLTFGLGFRADLILICWR